MTAHRIAIACVVFSAVAGADLVWTMYNKAVERHSANEAGLLSVCIYALGGITAIEYIKDNWMLVPALLGAFVGTWLGVRVNRARD